MRTAAVYDVVMNDYLKFAQSLADEAGGIMLEYFRVGVASRAKTEEGNTPVTIADTAINQLVIEAVQARYPRHSVLGEEESHMVAGADFTWVCDPVDGTIPYSMGVPTNVFSLALVNGAGQPVVAVVLDPYMRRKYWAVAGSGAFMNGVRLRVNQTNVLEDAYVAGSGSRAGVIDAVALRGALIGQCYRIFILNSVIYEAMMVASGQIAAVIYGGKGAHDAASAALIVREAGGRVTDLLGREQRYDEPVRGAIVSNGVVHGALLELTERYRVRA